MNLEKQAIPKWLRENYLLKGVPKVTLLRSYTNDVYEVTDKNNKYVLKIYGKGWRTLDDICWEIELLEFIGKKGLLISKAVPAIDDKFVKSMGDQFAVLYNFAPGEKPQKPFTPDLYFLFGQAMGKIHKLSDDFKPISKRKDIDLTYLIDEPVRLATSFLQADDPNRKVLLEIASNVKSKITEVQKSLDWGPIHGDATLDNLHITKDNKIILYDFDSGGTGWRASDLQGWAVGNKKYKEKYNSFISGYRSAKELNEIDVVISPYLTIAWEIWGLEVELKNRIIKKGPAAVNEYLEKQISSIANFYGI